MSEIAGSYLSGMEMIIFWGLIWAKKARVTEQQNAISVVKKLNSSDGHKNVTK